MRTLLAGAFQESLGDIQYRQAIGSTQMDAGTAPYP
jgi:hypothetical protein